MAQTFSEVVKKYRTHRQASLRDFADDLSVDAAEKVSHATIKNWENEITTGSIYFFLAVALRNDDWRKDFALECIEAIKPGYYEQVTA